MNYPGASNTELHHGMMIPCFGLGQGSSGPCQTLISIALDMGPSAFRCPVCQTIYIVDPLVEANSETLGLDFTLTEIEGHRIEIHFGKGEIAQRTRSSYDVAWSFFTPKIGSIDNAYIAETHSAPGMGNEAFRQMAGGRLGTGSQSLPNVSQVDRKRSQAVTWPRVVLFLILILACVAAGVAIFMAVGP